MLNKWSKRYEEAEIIEAYDAERRRAETDINAMYRGNYVPHYQMEAEAEKRINPFLVAFSRVYERNKSLAKQRDEALKEAHHYRERYLEAVQNISAAKEAISKGAA